MRRRGRGSLWSRGMRTTCAYKTQQHFSSLDFREPLTEWRKNTQIIIHPIACFRLFQENKKIEYLHYVDSRHYELLFDMVLMTSLVIVVFMWVSLCPSLPPFFSCLFACMQTSMPNSNLQRSRRFKTQNMTIFLQLLLFYCYQTHDMLCVSYSILSLLLLWILFLSFILIITLSGLL